MKPCQLRRLDELKRNRHKRTRGGLTYEQWCRKGRDAYLTLHQNHRRNAWFQQKKRSSAALSLPKNDHPAKRARTHKQRQRHVGRQKTDQTTTAASNVAAHSNENDNLDSTSYLGDDSDEMFMTRNYQQSNAGVIRIPANNEDVAAKGNELPPSTEPIETREEEDDIVIIMDDIEEEQEKSVGRDELQQMTTTTMDTPGPSASTGTYLCDVDAREPAPYVSQEDPVQEQQNSQQVQKRPSMQQPSSLIDTLVDSIFPSRKRRRSTFARSSRLQHHDLTRRSGDDTGVDAQQQHGGESSFLTFDVGSSTGSTPQFWALVEGIVSYDTSASHKPSSNSATSLPLAATSYWQDLWMDRRVDLLPTTGRVLELLPVESKPGSWNACVVRLVHSSIAGTTKALHSRNDKLKPIRQTKAVPCHLGLLRESAQDWRNKRVVLRHASIPIVTVRQNDGTTTTTTGSSFDYLSTTSVPAGYSVSVIDPSLHRSAALRQQGVLSGTRDRSPASWTVASLSLVAFEGFSSFAESGRHAPTLAKNVLQACAEDSFWHKHNQKQQQQRFSVTPPDLMTIPAFGDNQSNNSTSKTKTVQGSGGISLLGNIVDALRSLDYQILILREEATNRIVGLDVVFCSKGTVDSSPSSTNVSPSEVKQKGCTLPLTTQNLELHNEKEASYEWSSSTEPPSECEDRKSNLAEEQVEHQPSPKRRLKTNAMESAEPTGPSSADFEDEKAITVDENLDEEMLIHELEADEPVDSQLPTRIDPSKPSLPAAPVTVSRDEMPCPLAQHNIPYDTTTSMMTTSSVAEKTEVRKPAGGLPRITPTPAGATTTPFAHSIKHGETEKVHRRLFSEKQVVNESCSSDYYDAHEEQEGEISGENGIGTKSLDVRKAREEEETEAAAFVGREVCHANSCMAPVVCFHDLLYGGLKNDGLEAHRAEVLAVAVPPLPPSKFAAFRLLQACSDIFHDEEDEHSLAEQIPTVTWLYDWMLAVLLLLLFSPALLHLLGVLQSPHSLCFSTTPIDFGDKSYFPDDPASLFRLQSFLTEDDVSSVFLLFAGGIAGRNNSVEYLNEIRPLS